MDARQDVLLLDIDGVVLDFTAEYLWLLELLHGVRKTEADITDFDFAKCIATKEQDRAIWQYLEQTPGRVYGLGAYPGAMDFLADLRKLGRVVACTSPANPLWTAERAAWLLEVGGFSKKDIVIASDKALIGGDFLIDDAVHNLASWQEGGGQGGFALCLARPWNTGGMLGVDYWDRAFNYDHMLAIIQDLQ